MSLLHDFSPCFGSFFLELFRHSPVMDGLEATRLIRKMPHLASLPVIAMTANAMSEDKERCIAAGMNDHITKPIDPEQLFYALLKWIPPKNGTKLPQNIQEAFVKTNPSENVFNIDIPGVDTQTGLKRVLGKKDFYLSILKKYTVNQKNTITEIKKALESEDYNTAERLTHTLKGVSGNIGAEAVQEKAALLESLFKEHAPEEKLKAVIEETDKLLKYVTEGIIKALPPDIPGQQRSGRQASAAELLNLLQELKPYVEAHKPKKCAGLMNEYRKLIWPAELENDASRFDKLVSTYRFSEAAKILNSLLESLQR